MGHTTRRLRSLSLPQRFLVTPVLWLLVLGLLTSAFIYESRRQNALLNRVTERDLAAFDRSASVFVNVTEQHTALYDLLNSAGEIDEGTLYDRAKESLRRIAQAVDELEHVLPSASPGADPGFTARRDDTLSRTRAYLKGVTFAVEMSTVDLRLAPVQLARANERFTAMNRSFATLLHAERGRIGDEIATRVRRDQVGHVTIAFAGGMVAVLLLVASVGLSRILSRSMEAQIGVLTELGAEAGARLAVADGDEVERMAVAIAAFREVLLELRRSRDELEQRVLERSRELSIANDDLRSEIARSEARRREAEALAEVGRVLSQTRDPDVVAHRVVETVASLLRCRMSVLSLTDPGTGHHVVKALTAGGPTELRTGTVIEPGTDVIGRVVADRAPLATADVLTDPRVRLQPSQRAGYEVSGTRSVLAVPLIVQDRVIGALTLADEVGRTFDADATRVAWTFADQAARALESARLSREADRMVAELHAKNTELDSFVHSVSHDLRGPLITIQGMANSLAEDFSQRLDEGGRHYLERLCANVAKMEALIHDLLALSRAGRDATPPEMVDLDALSAQLLTELDDAIRMRGITVTCAPLGALWGAPVLLEQVLRNLIGNAVKYNRPTDGRIELGRIEHDDTVEIWVKDDGIGIDPAYHDTVFEIFQRLKENDAEGSGVGLAIVRKVVTRVGGRVWVESARGEGATFRFTWPLGPPRDGILSDAPEKVRRSPVTSR